MVRRCPVFGRRHERGTVMSILKHSGKCFRLRFVTWLTVLFLGINLILPRNIVALSPSDEQTIARETLEKIRAIMPLVEDGEVQTYVQAVGNRVTKQLGTTTYQYRFF